MLKQITLLKRKPGMSMAEFIDYYENHHARMGEPFMRRAKRYQRRYVRPEVNPITGEVVELDFDVVMELWWESRADFEATMAEISGDPAVAWPDICGRGAAVLLARPSDLHGRGA